MWALSLSAEGHAALRIDLPGSGDSGGSPRDAGRAASWPRAVAASAAWLRERTGADRVVAIGIGLGGLVAGQAVVEGADIDDLVLWGAPARGKALVRELRAFARLGISRTDDVDWDLATMPPLPEGSLESGGFLLAPESVAWLQGDRPRRDAAAARRAPARAAAGARGDQRRREAARCAGRGRRRRDGRRRPGLHGADGRAAPIAGAGRDDRDGGELAARDGRCSRRAARHTGAAGDRDARPSTCPAA